MQIGTVLFFNRLKGFGFLETADGDLFFHVSEIMMPGPVGSRRLEKGQPVNYELGQNPKRGNTIAVRVTPVAGGSDGE